MTPVQLATLKSEILTDPQTYGYAAHVAAGEPELIAAKLNTVRTGADGETAIVVKRPDLPPLLLLEAIDVRDLIAPATGNLTLAGSWLESVLQSVQPLRLLNEDGSTTRVRTNLNRMLTDTQGSQTRFDALAQRNGSRAELLFGFGTIISMAEVGQALSS